MSAQRAVQVPVSLIERALDFLDQEVPGAHWVARDFHELLSRTSVQQRPKRIRPWRCTVCSDRFAHEQDPALGHRTVYEPREWEKSRTATDLRAASDQRANQVEDGGHE